MTDTALPTSSRAEHGAALKLDADQLARARWIAAALNDALGCREGCSVRLERAGGRPVVRVRHRGRHVVDVVTADRYGAQLSSPLVPDAPLVTVTNPGVLAQATAALVADFLAVVLAAG